MKKLLKICCYPHHTPVLMPGKSHGWRSLVGCSPWGRKESDTTERLDFHFSLSCIGVGNGNPLQCSCLERIPGMGEPGGLPYMGLHRVRHDWSNLAAAAHHTSKFLFLSFFYERSSLAPLVGKWKQALQNTSHCHLIVKHVASLLFRQHYIEQYEIIDSWQLLTLRSLKTV